MCFRCFQVTFDKALNDEITTQLQLHCANWERGCKWVGGLSKLKARARPVPFDPPLSVGPFPPLGLHAVR